MLKGEEYFSDDDGDDGSYYDQDCVYEDSESLQGEQDSYYDGPECYCYVGGDGSYYNQYCVYGVSETLQGEHDSYYDGPECDVTDYEEQSSLRAESIDGDYEKVSVDGSFMEDTNYSPQHNDTEDKSDCGSEESSRTEEPTYNESNDHNINMDYKQFKDYLTPKNSNR